jgi:hypothetical protein
MSTSPRPPAVSTVSLLAYLATIYAWMLEGLVLVIHLFTNRNLDPLGHWTLIAVSVALTAFAWVRGKREFKRLRWTRGRIPLTGKQTFLIAAILIAFSCVMAFVAERLIEH